MKAVLHYLLLVGIPVLGVLALLRAGAHLAAPVSVGGDWTLEVNSEVIDNPACTSLSTQFQQQPILTISQSGPHLRLTFKDEGNTTLAGKIDDMTIIAGAIPPPAAANTPDNKSTLIRFEAVVDRQAEPDRLEGTLIMNHCPDSMLFTAIRQPVSRDSRGGH